MTTSTQPRQHKVSSLSTAQVVDCFCTTEFVAKDTVIHTKLVKSQKASTRSLEQWSNAQEDLSVALDRRRDAEGARNGRGPRLQ